MLDFMTPISLIVSVVSLAKSQEDGRHIQSTLELISWLQEHNHDDIVKMINQNNRLSISIDQLLHTQHDELIELLQSIQKIVSDISIRFDGMSEITKSAGMESILSNQAIFILQQFNKLGAASMYDSSHQGAPIEFTFTRYTDKLNIIDYRFVADDLHILCSYALLREEYDGHGNPKYFITRLGSEIGDKSSPQI